jgi:hypothetical protein
MVACDRPMNRTQRLAGPCRALRHQTLTSRRARRDRWCYGERRAGTPDVRCGTQSGQKAKITACLRWASKSKDARRVGKATVSHSKPFFGLRMARLIEDRIVACIHFARNALMPSPNLDRRLVRYSDAIPYEDRQQRDRDADKRGPDEEPDEAGMLDYEAREPSQNAARKGAE